MIPLSNCPVRISSRLRLESPRSNIFTPSPFLSTYTGAAGCLIDHDSRLERTTRQLCHKLPQMFFGGLDWNISSVFLKGVFSGSRPQYRRIWRGWPRSRFSSNLATHPFNIEA